ncbi:PDZ domain-containing protein [candidate division KSB1 bacterium]|nr:PDZ domain-containing protein [candidate division KSB1 bacterium]
MKHRHLYIAALVVFFTSFSGLFVGLRSDSARDLYYKVKQNVMLFGQVYQAITDRYVEEVDPEKFIRAGIHGMLDELDPYSVYLEKESSDELRIMTEGKYYGVGMRIVIRNGWATVAEPPFPNSPAARAGIREGDQIISVDGQSTKGFSLSETANKLRGREKGSAVTIQIKRYGEEKPLEFRLLRDEIEVTDVHYTGFVRPNIGLIKLDRFNRSAGQQVREAVQSLKDQGMTALILDLRGNPGGLLDVAVSVADNFIDKGELIVYTQGRWENTRQEYRASRESLIGDMPMAVLVDGYSASASEIVAGAIQDLDRGVVLGSETFGKGLVQTVVPLDRRGERQVKITTAQYYMPSGRLIQRPEVFNRGPGSVLVNSSDSVAQKTKESKQQKENEKDAPKYFTQNGRTVYGGGGIKPDIESSSFRMNRYEIELMRRSMFFNYGLEYVDKHPNLAKDFALSEEDIESFFQFVDNKEFDYKPEGFQELEEIAKIAQEENYYDELAPSIDAMKEKFEIVKQKERKASQDHIRFFLKREIAGKAFGRDAYTEAMFASDSTLIKAVNVLQSPDEYNKILGTKLATSE